MKLLVLGAGAVGGYFGGRLVEAGGDVTFLVRPPRAETLRANSLVIKSPAGDTRLLVKTIGEREKTDPFDLVLLACKAYDLDHAIEAVRPHVETGATVLPLLNGMAHIDQLRETFGAERVIGGTCHIGATMSPSGEILHFDLLARMTFGAFEDQPNIEELEDRLAAFADLVSKANFSGRRVEPIDQSIWDKWVVLSTLAGMTTLMRAGVGDIMHTREGDELIEEFLHEAIGVAEESGYSPSVEFLAGARKVLFDRNSTLMASMLRDLEKGGAIEGEHLIGDMYRRAHEFGLDATLLRLAYCHLQAYEARRKREAKS
jgi:2-dehydropantoate 2-reductase